MPTGVVTFVLTDVVDSTRLWERVPGAMERALARHDEIVVGAVTAEDGSILRSKGEGDSTFSVFGRASDALRAAYRLQRAIRLEPWPVDAVIRVRVAVDTGEAIERDGDYLGSAVNRVARLRTAARGGEVVVGAATAAIVRRDLPAGCELIDLGLFELRGLEKPERAFALAAGDLDPVDPSRSSSSDARTVPDGVSRREAEVLALVGMDLTNAEIAARLYISAHTVASHVSSLLRKLGAADRRDLARLGLDVVSSAGKMSVSPALPATFELLADESTFVGRKSERETLRRRWQLARAGHTVVVLVTGEAGVGKSRLVSELAAEVHMGGSRVLLGCSYEDVDQPYGPFVQAISADAADLSGAEVRRRVFACGGVLARLSPVLSRAFADGGGREAGDDTGTAERAMMLDAIVGWFVSSASTTPLMLVVEDLHWSTHTTRDLLRHLVRNAGRKPLLIVATARDTAPDLDGGLRALLGDLERSPAVARIALHGLDRDEVAALANVSHADAEVIVADTGGNPLLVTHMTAEHRQGSLAALLSHRDELLDAEARDVLDMAATFGSEFEADLLALANGAQLLSVLAALERTEAAGLVVPLPGRPGRFGFVHALFRSHRYDALPLRRRLELHARAAAALATRSDDPRVLSERARHACLAVPVGDARLAVDLAREAAHEAEHSYAYDEAATHYRRGLDAARSLDPPDPRATLDLTIRLAAVLHRLGNPHGLPMLLHAAQRARDEGDRAALVRTARSLSQFGGSRVDGSQKLELVSVIEDALAILGEEPSAARAQLLIELANTNSAMPINEQIELAHRAEAMARDVDDPEALAQVLLVARHIAYHPSRLDEYERIGVDLEHLGRHLPSLAVKLAGIGTQTSARLQRGDVAGWNRGVDRFNTLVGDHSLSFFQLDVLLNGAQRAFLSGDLGLAEELALNIVPLARSAGRDPNLYTGATILLNRRLQARDAELRVGLEYVVAKGDDVAAYQCVLAAVEARTGSFERARHMLSGLRADEFAIPESYPWPLAMTELAEVAEVSRRPRDRPPRPRRMRPLLRPDRRLRNVCQPTLRPGARPSRPRRRRRRSCR